MTLDNVIDEIISKAESDAKALKDEGMREAKEILKKAKDNTLEVEKTASGDAKKMAEAMERKELASAKLVCKRIELDAKKEVIDEVFDSLKEKISKVDERTKKRIYEKILKNTATEMDVKYAYVNPKDRSLVKSISKGIEIKDADIIGGMIFENEVQNVRIDCTFDSVLEDVKEECLKDVSKILFKSAV